MVYPERYLEDYSSQLIENFTSLVIWEKVTHIFLAITFGSIIITIIKNNPHWVELYLVDRTNFILIFILTALF